MPLGEPPIKALPGVRRQRTLRGNSQGCSEHSNHNEFKARLASRGITAAQAPQQIHRTEQALAQAQAVAANPRMQQFRFQQRHVHVRRAFRRACFAREAIAQRRLQLRGASARRHWTPRNSSAARIAFARPRVDMISSPGRHEGGAHGRSFLAASAAPIALLQVADERAILRRKSQHRRERQFQLVTGAQPQVGIDLEAPVGQILPGLKRLCGSNDFLISRITSSKWSPDLLRP